MHLCFTGCTECYALDWTSSILRHLRGSSVTGELMMSGLIYYHASRLALSWMVAVPSDMKT
jgi:hypothetical protein